ncbi:uncharacterized protein LOC127790029 [Diospyros lotus]|uniref:uncharacterized protein LOC127790029 n=1 Tax=Diospyros lotus TaxID=55363 RepID=UPI002252E9E9|nr:uncharacterized protein LOC127790029 [Diospyros lotus]XP_052175218.1 uncharacterized protein LOC127790029 [Diospyros lotus]XP_052175219.1 uncharacterized protein LOC127790029 [Diospyros lotus]
MGDETPNTMNLDLNLGPFPSPDDEQESGSVSNDSVSLEDWMDGRVNQLRQVLRLTRRRWRRQDPVLPRNRDVSLEFLVNSSSDAGVGGGLQTGEASVSPGERNAEVIKTCENDPTHVENDGVGKNGSEEKGNGEGGSFFDCNICLDMAKEPVVTCCGHLFCWPCLYRWLHLHSFAKECPVCKGEVTSKSITPIYGRGSNTCGIEEEQSVKVPLRPHARRVESWRQTLQRSAFSFPMETMIRRLGSRFDLTRELVQAQQQNREGAPDLPDSNNSLLNRILTSRGIRREHNPMMSPDVVFVDLTPSNTADSEVGESRRLSSLLLRRSQTHRAATISNLTSALNSTEALVESYFGFHPLERNQEQPPPPVDDRDSMSSIAAVIHSESQTVDTALEIDSTVSRSTSSSRRRNDASRVSDVDSGDSRAHRRRRLN